jgi:hypothetical protein
MLSDQFGMVGRSGERWDGEKSAGQPCEGGLVDKSSNSANEKIPNPVVSPLEIESLAMEIADTFF